MSVSEKIMIADINALHKIQVGHAGLVSAKFINVKGNKECACCKQTISNGQRALTSSIPVDKKYNMTYGKAYDDNCVKKYKYVLVRQWMHPECAKDMINKAQNIEIKDRWYKRKNIDDIDFELLDLQEQIEILKYFYEKDDISYDEFMDIIDFHELDADTELTLLRYFHNKGDISNEEYQRIEDGLIEYLAFDEAVGLGQE